MFKLGTMVCVSTQSYLEDHLITKLLNRHSLFRDLVSTTLSTQVKFDTPFKLDSVMITHCLCVIFSYYCYKPPRPSQDPLFCTHMAPCNAVCRIYHNV